MRCGVACLQVYDRVYGSNGQHAASKSDWCKVVRKWRAKYKQRFPQLFNPRVEKAIERLLDPKHHAALFSFRAVKDLLMVTGTTANERFHRYV